MKKYCKLFVFGFSLLVGLALGTSSAFAQTSADYGDAPDGGPTGYPNAILVGGETPAQVGAFPSLLSSDGARVLNPNQVTLGPSATVESDALITNNDSDDGIVDFVIILDSIPPPAVMSVDVNSQISGTYYLNVLIDLNMDGMWDEFGDSGQTEWVVQNQVISVGPGNTEVTTEPFAFSNGNRIPNTSWMRVALTDSPIRDTNWAGTGEFNSGEIEDYFIELAFTDSGAKPKLTIDCGSEKKYFEKNQKTLKFNCFIENWVLSMPPPAATLTWTLKENAQIGAVNVDNTNSNCPVQNPAPTFGGIDLKANCNLPLAGKVPPRLGLQREAALGFEATKIGPLPSKWTATVSTPDPSAIITSNSITPGYGMSQIQVEFLEELMPLWIRDVAGWWADGKTTDREFATGIAFLIKEQIIQVQNIKTDPNGEIEIDENLRLPGWIKNNAKWWKENSISDNDFKSGIQFMVKEKIIQFTTKGTQISCPSDDFCKPLLEELKNRIPIPPSSHIFYAKVEPGTILTEEFDWENRVSLEIPKTKGDYYAFFIDYNPETKFGHTVAYAWMDLKSMSFDFVNADWPPVITYDDKILSYSPSSEEVAVDSVNIQPENWQIQEDKDENQKREPVYDVSHKSIATGPAPKSFKPYQKVALLIDFGDNPPRSPSSLDVAKSMAEDADNIQKYLDDNGYQTNRVSNYHGNNYPRVDSASDVTNLLEAYSKAFDCDPDVPCGHEFFLFMDGHGSRPFQSNKTGNWVGSSLNIYKADGSGNPEEGGWILDSSINYVLKRFAPCVKIIVFIDSCYGGSMIQDSFEILEDSCKNKPCGMTIMAGNSKRESTYVKDGAPTKFLAGSDKDHDGDGIKGDLRDRFEELKRLQKQDIRKSYGDENPYMDDGMDAQLFLCSQNQPLCSMDGPTRIGINDVRGVHISSEPPSLGITRYGQTGEWIDNGNGTYAQIPTTLPPLTSRVGYYEIPIPTTVSLLPGTQMYNDLEPDISSNNASWLGEKKTGETFSIDDVTFWVDTPKLPTGYFYTGKLFPSLAVEGPIDPKGFSDIRTTGEGTFKGSFSFECYYEGDAKVTQLVSLYWQLWKGNNPNDLKSATKVTQGIISADRESRLKCVGDDSGLIIDPETTEYYYDWKTDTNIILDDTDYTITDEDLIEIDSDNDGISDIKDSCPYNPETVNGYEDLDGCPDTLPATDSDGDGINDNLDSCPTQPETVNGYEDSDGCPDTPPIESDTTPPIISVPSNTIIESSEELTPVTFNAISNDDVDGNITPTCDPPSGFLFPVGTTTVTCTATDSAGNTATKSFTVEVIYVDIKPPEITISSINSIESGDGFIVTYDATAEDNVDGSVEVSCDPPSGSFFPEGIHRITCTATDSAGNTATQAIDVTVTRVE